MLISSLTGYGNCVTMCLLKFDPDDEDSSPVQEYMDNCRNYRRIYLLVF